MPRFPILFSTAAILLMAAPAHADQDRPLTDSEPDAMDVAKTPVTDLNISQREIPQVLLRARYNPYEMTGLRGCRQIAAAVVELDELLGPDLDLPQEERDRITAGRAAKAVVGYLIPFRGLIREVSGANKYEDQLQAAIQAGLARRGFLKGMGQQRGCDYPARAATSKDIAAFRAQREREAERESGDRNEEQGKPSVGQTRTQYSSEPVVQPTN